MYTCPHCCMTTVVDANTYTYIVKMSLEHKVIMVHISILSSEHCAVVEARVRAWSTTLKIGDFAG